MGERLERVDGWMDVLMNKKSKTISKMQNNKSYCSYTDLIQRMIFAVPAHSRPSRWIIFSVNEVLYIKDLNGKCQFTFTEVSRKSLVFLACHVHVHGAPSVGWP